jgi:hypothetical protein
LEVAFPADQKFEPGTVAAIDFEERAGVTLGRKLRPISVTNRDTFGPRLLPLG